MNKGTINAVFVVLISMWILLMVMVLLLGTIENVLRDILVILEAAS